jgi:hypothetical protein
VQRAAQERGRLESLVADLAQRLRQAEQEPADAVQQLEQAQGQRDRSAGEVRGAARGLDTARARLDAPQTPYIDRYREEQRQPPRA